MKNAMKQLIWVLPLVMGTLHASDEEEKKPSFRMFQEEATEETTEKPVDVPQVDSLIIS